MTGRLVRSFGGRSIARTLTLVISVTAVIAVALACAAFVAYYDVSARGDIVRNVDAIAGVVGGNCAAAIAFKDPGAARRVLSALASDPHIVEAAVFPGDGSTLATWTRTRDRAAPVLGRDGARTDGNVITVFRAIVFDNERVGTVYVATSLDELYRRRSALLLATLFVLGGATMAAFILSGRIQRLVSQPILELASAARRVSALQDYSIRVPVRVRNEVGTLTDSFNEMLSQISARDGQLIRAHADLAAHFSRLETEVGERRRAEEALRASEERFRQIAETIREVFWLTDPQEGRFVYVSRAYEHIWGRTCESLYLSPRDWTTAIHPDDQARVLEAARTRAAENRDEEYRIVRPDGTIRWIRDRSVPVRDASGRVIRVAGVADDVTDERQLEAQLRQAQKMQAIGTLAGGIAHDFNNILGAIMGYTELASMDIDAGRHGTIGENLAAVAAASRRARDLVQQILAFSLRQDETRLEMHLAPVIKEAIRLLRASLPSSIDVRMELDAETPPVLADPTQVHQIVMNLGTNAWHAMPGGGILELQLGALEADAAFVRAHVDLAVGRYAHLAVRDTGCGMDPATVTRIFEPFFTTKAPGEGTGLGLSTVHGIMKSHAGAIFVESEPGHGTTFHVYFPALDAVVAPSATPVETVTHGHGQHILLVDDEPALLGWKSQALERLGYRVSCHGDALEALQAISDRPEAFDLVVTDLTMPGANGVELAEGAQRLRAGLPVILTTGNATALTADAIRRCGIREVLPKPSTIKALGDAVHRALTQKEGTL
jgi:PAS domain S-box-containing protein